MRPVIALSVAAGVLGAPIAMAPSAQAAGGQLAPVINVIQEAFAEISGAGSIASAFQQISAQIQQVQASIINEVDNVAVANVQACTAASVDNFSNINLLTPANLQLFAENAVQCVALAEATINGVSSPAAIDAAGFAMNSVGPIAIVSSEMAGFSVSGLDGTLIAGENSLISLLTPPCTKDFVEGTNSGFFLWLCTAYNGDQGDTKPMTQSQADATADTSRAIAENVLPSL
jgi:hypothetical protein